jgi:hypothetical protein
MTSIRGRVVRTVNHFNGKPVWVLSGLGQPLDGVVMAVGVAGKTISEEVWGNLAYVNDRRVEKGLPMILAEIVS